MPEHEREAFRDYVEAGLPRAPEFNAAPETPYAETLRAARKFLEEHPTSVYTRGLKPQALRLLSIQERTAPLTPIELSLRQALREEGVRPAGQ